MLRHSPGAFHLRRRVLVLNPRSWGDWRTVSLWLMCLTAICRHFEYTRFHCDHSRFQFPAWKLVLYRSVRRLVVVRSETILLGERVVVHFSTGLNMIPRSLASGCVLGYRSVLERFFNHYVLFGARINYTLLSMAYGCIPSLLARRRLGP